jgi:hypothetical protein
MPRRVSGCDLVLFGICNMERYALYLLKTRKIGCFCRCRTMSNPLNKRLRVNRSLGFASGEVVFKKEGSGKDPRLAGEHQNFMRRGNQ